MADVSGGFTQAATRIERNLGSVRIATFTAARVGDRNERLRQQRRSVLLSLKALDRIASIRPRMKVSLGMSPEAREAARLRLLTVLDTLREQADLLERERAPIFRMCTAAAPDLSARARTAHAAAVAAVTEVRVALALALGERAELDALGYVPTPMAPVGTRGKPVPLEDVLREFDA